MANVTETLLRASTAAIFMGALVASLVASCADESSNPPGGSTGGGGSSVGGGGVGGVGGEANPCAGATSCADCQTCALEDACQTAFAACVGNPQCVGFDECVAGCGETVQCVNTCAVAYPGGQADYFDFMGCIRCDTCADACPGNCAILHCINGTTDEDEPGVDCGGADCDRCVLGDPCFAPGDCETGFCADGICCETECTGGCLACSGALTGQDDGSCLPITAGTDPDDECADTDVCNGVDGCQCTDGALSGDESDVDCGGLACLPCDDGETCLVGDDCASGNCADGVCCNTACEGLCEACNQAGSLGSCLAVPSGADPDDDCADEGAGTCGTNGVCNGSGTCSYYGQGTACGDAASCTNGVQTNPDSCDGAGSCTDYGTVTCAPYVCGPSACLQTCSNHSDCITGQYCDGQSQCQPLRANGVGCNNGYECSSTVCADGVCCEGACGGLCQACTNAKTGQPDGVCATIPAAMDPDAECPDDGAGSCDRNGFCNGLGACQIYAPGTVCGASSCTNGSQTGNQCDGSGNCNPAQTLCTPYVCAGNVCATSCVNDTGCVSASWCNGSACLADQGQGASCTAPSQCSGNVNCVDGFCCNSSCTTLCNACSAAKKGSGANGACGTIGVGTDPDNECTPGMCNGGNLCQCADGAKNGAETDVDCGGGTCTACAIGKTCLAGTDCSSTNCVDGYCCDTACPGVCNACSAAKKGSGANGVCGAIANGADPDLECTATAQSTCSTDGYCNGASACRLWASGTTCAAHAICDGGGTCYCSDASWQDCVNGMSDGCETNTTYNNTHCGSCGESCSGSAWECLDGQCMYLCQTEPCVTYFGCSSGQQCNGSTWSPYNPQCGSACCAAPDTLVATPEGERPIASLREGDLVYSIHRGLVEAVPILRVSRVEVDPDHVIVRVALDGGRIVEMSPGHPTADGRTFAELEPGGVLGGVPILRVEQVGYGRPRTHDILPASDSGTYFAAGALVGSTLGGWPLDTLAASFAPPAP